MESYWRTLSREVLWFNSCLYKDQSGCSGEVSEERQQGDTFEAFSKMMDWSAANCTLKTSLKPDRVTLKKKKGMGTEEIETIASLWKLESHGNWLSMSETAEDKGAREKTVTWSEGQELAQQGPGAAMKTVKIRWRATSQLEPFSGSLPPNPFSGPFSVPVDIWRFISWWE